MSDTTAHDDDRSMTNTEGSTLPRRQIEGGGRANNRAIREDVPISSATQPQQAMRTHGARTNTKDGNQPNTQKPDSKIRDAGTVTMPKKNARSLTNDDSKIREFIQELGELKDGHWDFCHDQRDL